MVNLMESKIPDIYSRGLDEKSILVGANHTDKVATVLFSAVSNCLHDCKSKEYPIAFAFENLVGDTIACAVVEFHASEDKDQPGNWSYVWSFDKKIIPEGARVLKITDTQAQQYFVTTASNKFNMGFESPQYIVELMNFFLEILSKYLDDNAKEGEQNGVTLDGVFQARVSVEDGEVVKAIEMIGETKAIIKSDDELEV